LAACDRLTGNQEPKWKSWLNLEAGLQLPGGLEAGVAAGLAGVHGGLLSANPIAEVGHAARPSRDMWHFAGRDNLSSDRFTA
jgi:hypothetical protein